MTAWKGLHNTIFKELWIPLKYEYTHAFRSVVPGLKKLGALSKAELVVASKGERFLKTWLSFQLKQKAQKWIFQKQSLEEGQAVTLRQLAYGVPGKAAIPATY